MPRLIASEYVYSGALDDCYNDYNIRTPLTTSQQQLHHLQQQQQQQHHLTATMETSSIQERTKSRSQSPTTTAVQLKHPTQSLSLSANEIDKNTPNCSKYREPEQQIHTISSSDEDEQIVNVRYLLTAAEDEIACALSDDTGDFKGFDDYTTPISSGIVNDVSQEDIHNSINYLKRHSYADEYHEDSEGVVEAIEVDDDDEEFIAMGDEGDQQIMYKSMEEVTPVKSQTHRFEYSPHTPSKRKKQENEKLFNDISPTHLKTPPDQIVEINSDSTTNSQKQKRQQINTKFQLNLSQQQPFHKVNNANKCSTESTSEFPASSPSNPQQPRGGGKYPPRPPLLKNTLPADSFERQLAMITACNPQMTLAEKIQTWVCDEELSDVEDVNNFDEEFKRVEAQKITDLKQKDKGRGSRGNVGAGVAKQSADIKNYDFSIFRQMIGTIKAQQNLKYFGGGQGGGNFQLGGEALETSGSESSRNNKHMDYERPSTSAVAQQQLMQQRRSKPLLNFDSGEIKKRIVKENPKRNQNSTTPPQTSSSDNERECFQKNSKNHTGHDKLQHNRQIHIHDKLLCPSSSEEANSQDIPTHMQLKTNQRLAQATLNNLKNKSPPPPTSSPVKQNENKAFSKNVRSLTDEEIDSVFRLHRLNREIDKGSLEKPTETSSECTKQTRCLIQMRLDSTNENKTKKLSMEKKQELFKTPIIPQKYLANAPTPNESPTDPSSYSTATKPFLSDEQSVESPTQQQPVNRKKLSKALENVKHEIAKDDKKLEENKNETDLEGVYHQQHEFCNYLGLTGMSTATAMANAVAELAQCNLARRSMRVLRQQQQERKDKSAKEERELQALKIKKSKELRKRERNSTAGDTAMDMEDILHKSDEGSHSQTSEPTPSTPSLKEIKKRISINSLTKSSSQSQISINVVNKEQPETKMGHKMEEAVKVSKELSIEYPIREKLMRQAKQSKPDTAGKEDDEDEENKADNNTIAKEKENDKILQENKGGNPEINKEVQCETKTDSGKKDKDDNSKEKIPFTAKQEAIENRRRSLRSPRLTPTKSQLKVTPTKIKIDVVEQDLKSNLKDTEDEIKLKDETEKLENQMKKDETETENENEKLEQPILTTPVDHQLELLDVGDNLSLTKSLETKINSTFIKVLEPIINKEQTNLQKSAETKNSLLSSSCDTKQNLSQLQKIKKALEESRKSKPSIFIVQSLDSKKEPAINTTTLTTADNAINKIERKSIASLKSPSSKVQIEKPQTDKSFSKSLKTSNKLNKMKLRKGFRKRNIKKRITRNLKNAPVRQLRQRKIIVIKAKKPKTSKLRDTPIEVHQKELRSASKLSKSSTNTELSPKKSSTIPPISHETKSYRTVHTETKDLETYLDLNNSQRKTRLMAKASALIERSRRMTLRGGSSTNIKTKKRTKSLKPQANVIRASATAAGPAANKRKYNSSLLLESREKMLVGKMETEVQTNITALNLLDNENVVVSSTTNTYDERPSSHQEPSLVLESSPITTLRSVLNNASSHPIHSSPAVETKEQFTQSTAASATVMGGAGTIRYLNVPPSATQTMQNPLKSENGVVLYIYYELDILIVIQEHLVSFWKCLKLLNILTRSLPPTKHQQQQQNKVNIGGHQQSSSNTSVTLLPKANNIGGWCNSILLPSSVAGGGGGVGSGFHTGQPASSTLYETNTCGEWIQLGELRRLCSDVEISVPYANRLCLHNSIPIYLEMRAQQLPKNHRDCNLLSMYINIYYYHDEDMIAKCNSIQLDTIQSDVKSVSYTTLIDSRYFIMTWPQENLLGKTRSGLCKYSLTPQLDTLASIREFKSLRHTIRYLECMSDDKLIGFGDSQVTIWDHRSGDVLMNFDLEIPMGKNLGSVYYSSQDIEQNNMLILYQQRDDSNDATATTATPSVLMTIACTITHNQPSYRILQELSLPQPAFKNIKSAINTGDHLVLTGQNDEEIWISTTNPSLVTLIPKQDNKRFYNRERSQLIELTEKTLNIDTLANHILQLAAGLALKTKF